MNRLIIKRILAIMAAVVLLAGIIVGTAACANKPKTYIALGDSVSAGFGVEPGECHVSVFFEKLHEEKLLDEYHNLAQNGFTSAMLLEALQNPDNIAPFADNEITVITLNIGGNNIIRPFLAHLPASDELTESIIELMDFLPMFEETMTDAMARIFRAQELIDDFSLENTLELIEIIIDIIPMIEDVTGVLTEAEQLEIMGIIATLRGNFTDELEAALDESINAFAVEFPEIIKRLRAAAPDAVIIVNTVYNPVPPSSMGLLSGLHSRADELTRSLNDVIVREAASGDFSVADVYVRFAAEPNMADILNFNLDTQTLTLNFDFIHPNSTGHELIAKLNYEVYIGLLE